MARLVRPTFRRKTGLRLSKSEAALEHGFKERDVVTVGDVTSITLTRIPDLIIVPDLAANCAINIAVPAADPVAADRVVRVVNQDSTQTVTLAVNGGTPTSALAGAKTADYYIADSSANTAPVPIFVQG